MGSGKSQSAITYMNEHSNEKFIYITPFLDEATRIKEACPSLNFIEPSDALFEFRFRKHIHATFLIKNGFNLATTHQAFKKYTPDILEDIKRQGYTLIIDENVDVLESADYKENDIRILTQTGYITQEDNTIISTNQNYTGNAHADMLELLKSRNLVEVQDSKAKALLYWILPPELITSFKNVFVLTYLFEAQGLHHLFHIHNIQYEYIGIERTDTGNGYRFCDRPNYVPAYVSQIKDMIHIMDNPKLNSIGDSRCALSINWFKKEVEKRAQLKKNIYNLIRNVWKDVPRDAKMWGTFCRAENSLRGDGYSKLHLVFNSRATNEYRHKTHLIYTANVFMNVGHRNFFESYGIDVNEDMYALSTMVQWIWRSAIRDGKEIYIYIPSSRMRRILTEWMESFQIANNSVSTSGSTDAA